MCVITSLASDVGYLVCLILGGPYSLCIHEIQDPSVIEDARFHQCVRYSRWLADRVLSFVPPDGQSTLMEYRVARRGSGAVIPVFVRTQIDYANGSLGRVNVMVGIKQELAAKAVEAIVVRIPLPSAAAHVDLNSNVGSVEVDMGKRTCVWTIGRLAKDSSTTPNLDGTVHLGDASVPMAAGVASLGENEIKKLDASESSDEAPVISVDFRVSGANVSGLGIAGLSLSNESYKLFKGAKLSTRSGKFEVRC